MQTRADSREWGQIQDAGISSGEVLHSGTRASGEGTNPFRDMQVVVTGTFNGFSRDEIMDLLESLGAITDNTVSGNTDFLIYGAMPSSKKVGEALSNGINLISEKSFTEMLLQNR